MLWRVARLVSLPRTNRSFSAASFALSFQPPSANTLKSAQARRTAAATFRFSVRRI
jgi:hypothetical protein